MAEIDLSVPHAGRLVRRIQALEGPLVQVWGWPGTGRAAVLETLLHLEPERAVGLSLDDLTGDAERRDRRVNGARWLVANSLPAELLAGLARGLRPGQRLVFATDRRLASDGTASAALTGLSTTLLAPQELLLEAREVAQLWYLLTGFQADPAAVHGLRTATDGWHQPLRLALEATGGTGLAEAQVEDLLDIPGVRAFLRHEVVEALPPEERELLLADPPPAGEWLGDGRPGWRRLIESRGLWIDTPAGERPPQLLAAYLARQRRRRPPARPAPPAEPATADTARVASRARPARPAAPPPTFVLGLLGEPVARHRDGETGAERDLGWRLRRSFQVLAFLASSPDLQAGREELIEAVWPREGERTIDRNFHPTLSHLRRALEGEGRGQMPPPLLFRNGVYRLNPEIHWEIDLILFRRLLDEGRRQAESGGLAPAAETWKSAWRLYRGPFLQGFYDAWVNARRETYQRDYLDLLRDLGDLYLRLAQLAEALDAYRAVLVEDPLQERVHLEVMRIYAAQGRRDLVRRQYDRLCTLLLEELGIEPIPETTQEYHRLMA